MKTISIVVFFMFTYFFLFSIKYNVSIHGSMCDRKESSNFFQIIKTVLHLKSEQAVNNLHIQIDSDLNVRFLLEEKIPFANLQTDSTFYTIDKDGCILKEGETEGLVYIFGKLDKDDIRLIYKASFQDFFKHCKYILMLRRNRWRIELNNNKVILSSDLTNVDDRIKKKFNSYDEIKFSRIDLRDEKKIVLY